MNPRPAFLAAALAAAAPAAFSQSPGALLSPAALSALEARGELRAVSTGKDAAPSLGLYHPAAAAIASELAAEDPDVVVEALFIWKKPRPADRPASLLAAYNTLRAVGSMQGIEYFSASRGKMRLFYETSSLADGPEGKTLLPDSPRASLPAAETLHARQKDLSFGDNVYRIDMRSGPDWVMSASVNLTAMRYGLIPVAAPGKLRVRVLVLDAGDSMVFYVVSSARAGVVPGIRGKLEDSFGNRAAAVFAWFGRKAGEAWARLP